MRCPAWSMQHVFLSPAGYVAAAQMYDAQRSGRNRGLIRSEGGQPPLCDSVANSLENRRFCPADTRNPTDAVLLAYLTAASAAAFATKNERMDREENGPQREERREVGFGEVGIEGSYFGESDAIRMQLREFSILLREIRKEQW
ncbi:hypothetical protein ALC62_12380 [Cyphomyrmex costatus]|uniref:Uncharacterized protein n=1 Tax=Cyphomyrmex costatus TaxID=456900 RepID=A0A151IBB7_9HYME|nr:hypothetical protein ALC62_12380 [Cyphomyrmex costatus]